MILDFDFQSTLVKYRILSNTITPRPIAWSVSVNENGLINIAPFSFFGVVSSNPAIFSLCLSPKTNGETKDTLNNVLATKKLTINLAFVDFIEQIQASASELDSHISEASAFNIPLQLIDSQYPPIIQGIKVAYFCDFLEMLEFGDYDKTLLLKVKSCYIEDSIYREDLRFLPPHLGRMGSYYLNPKEVIDPKEKG